MIHLDYLPGQKGFKNIKVCSKKALNDLKALDEGGVNGVIVENWKDNTQGPFVNEQTIIAMQKIIKLIANNTKLPVGVNVLPNDYRAAFRIAKNNGLQFIQLDVLVDKVKTNYSYSTQTPFDVQVDLKDFKRTRKAFSAEKVLVFASIQPKHYTMLEKKSIEKSTKQAITAGADVIVITGKVTGKQPVLEDITKAKVTARETPVFIGSGLSKENAVILLKHADGAIVGTAFKTQNFQKVVKQKVQSLMKEIKLITGYKK